MLPELTPLLVVNDHDVEALMRSARADLAKMSLELRALQHEAASAQSASATDEAAPPIDLDDARELLRTGVEARLARRRIERRVEIERAQRDAARRVADAEAEATALVDAARAQLLRALDGTTSPSTPAARRFAPPASPSIMPDDDPLPDSPWMPVATDDGDWILATEVVPPPAPPPPLRTSAPPAPRPPPEPPAAADDAEWRLVSEAVPPASPPPPPRPVSSAPPAADAEAAPVSFAPPRAAAQPARVPRRARRAVRWQGLLHADVLLPLIAVLIVAVLLLAWVA